MHFSKLLLLICLLLGLSVTAQATPKGKTFRVVSVAGNVYELTIAADQLQTMAPLPVALSIVDATGAPVKGAKVGCSLTMPAMAMPNNTPPIKEAVGPGRYEGIFLLTMGGIWNVNLAVEFGSGEREAVTLDVVAVVPRQSGGVDAQLEELFHGKGQAK